MERFLQLIEGSLQKPAADLPSAKDVWENLVSIANDNSRIIPFFYSDLSNFSQRVPEFVATTNELLAEHIAKLENQETSFSDKKKVAAFFCLVFQFLSPATVARVTKAFIAMAAKEISESKAAPKEVLSVLDLIEVSQVCPDSLLEVLNSIDGANECASAYVIATFAASLITNISEAFDAVPKLFTTLLQSSEDADREAGAFLAARAGDGPALSPELFEPLVVLLTSESEVACNSAHKAVRELVQSGAFDMDFILPIVLDQYKDYTSNNVHLFFKLVNAVIDTVEELPREYAEFVAQTIKSAGNSKEDAYKIGYLDVFCTLAARCNSAIGSLTKNATAIAKEMLNSCKAVGIVGAYVLAVVKCIPREVKTVLDVFIPRIVEIVEKEESVKLKDKLSALESIAVVAKENTNVKKETVDEIAKFVLQSLDKVTGTQVFYALSPVMELATLVDDEMYKSFYDKLFNLLMKEANSNEVNAIISTLVAYTKRKVVDQEVILRTVKAIIDATIPYMDSIKYQPIKDESTLIYFYLRKACKYYNAVVQKEVLPFFLEALKQSRTFMIPSVLDIVKGLQMDEETGTAVFYSILTKLPQLKRSDEEAICSCMESLSIILTMCPASFKADEAIQVVCSLIFSEGEEEEDVLPESYAFAAMVRICFAIYASDVPYTIDNTLFLDMIDLLPLDASLEDAMLPLYDSLSDIGKKPQFAFAIPLIAHIIVEPLVLPKSERLEFGISDALFNKMRSTLKFAVKAKRGLDRELSKGWQRAKINKLNAVLK